MGRHHLHGLLVLLASATIGLGAVCVDQGDSSDVDRRQAPLPGEEIGGDGS